MNILQIRSGKVEIRKDNGMLVRTIGQYDDWADQYNFLFTCQTAENTGKRVSGRRWTVQLKEIARKNATPKEYKAAGTILLNQSSSNDVNIELLKADLELIKSLTKLQLMDKFENLKNEQISISDWNKVRPYKLNWVNASRISIPSRWFIL